MGYDLSWKLTTLYCSDTTLYTFLSSKMADIKDVLDKVPTLGLQNEALSSKNTAVAVHRDYAGAQPKTDPEEIRLVRKLDWRIMVCVVFQHPIMSRQLDRGSFFFYLT